MSDADAVREAKVMKRRVYEYMLLRPMDSTELPTGIIDLTIYQDEQGYARYWGSVVYDRPLTGAEIDHCNLDGPLPCWM